MLSKTHRGVATLLLAGALVLATVGPAWAAPRYVTAGPDSFTPKRVRITQGTRVIWTTSSGLHKVVAYGGGWSIRSGLTRNHSVRKVFSHVGTFKYFCTYHATLSQGQCHGMCGKVVVTGS